MLSKFHWLRKAFKFTEFNITRKSFRKLFLAVRNCGFRPDLFWLVYLGQIISQLSWSFMISKAAVLANKWFKTNEISIATAIGSTGCLFGLAIGFLVPPFIVKTLSGSDKMPDFTVIGDDIFIDIDSAIKHLFVTKKTSKQHKMSSYPIYDCTVIKSRIPYGIRDGYFNCTNFDPVSCSKNSSNAISESKMLSDCEDFEHETQFQLIILFSISTSVSLLNLIALLIAYDRDPEIDEIPNFAERQRVSSGEF